MPILRQAQDDTVIGLDDRAVVGIDDRAVVA